MLFNPHHRAARMTVGTAHVVLQMSTVPVIFGCSEVVANRLCRCTSGKPAVAVRTLCLDGVTPQYALTEYGVQVKEKLEGWICLNEK